MRGVKEIELSKGQHALVDEVDFEWLNQWKWSASVQTGGGEKYRAVRVFVRDGKQKSMLMHRAILQAPPHMLVDHINRNPLDNRRENLRLTGHLGNALNRGGNVKGKTSRFKGVYWQKDISRWRARFRKKYLGTFTDEVEAAQAYDRAATAYDAVFAYVNFSEGEVQCRVP